MPRFSVRSGEIQNLLAFQRIIFHMVRLMPKLQIALSDAANVQSACTAILFGNRCDPLFRISRKICLRQCDRNTAPCIFIANLCRIPSRVFTQFTMDRIQNRLEGLPVIFPCFGRAAEGKVDIRPRCAQLLHILFCNRLILQRISASPRIPASVIQRDFLMLLQHNILIIF